MVRSWFDAAAVAILAACGVVARRLRPGRSAPAPLPCARIEDEIDEMAVW